VNKGLQLNVYLSKSKGRNISSWIYLFQVSLKRTTTPLVYHIIYQVIPPSLDISDDELFKDPPPKEEICFQPMPFAPAQTYGASPMYQPCCGKILCTGCMITSVGEMSEGTIKPWCPYCRIPMYRSRKEYSERLENRTDLNDAEAFYELGKWYKDGSMGLPQDMNKAFQLLNRAAELGSINAHNSLAHAYLSGRGVEKDMNKTEHHWKLAAIGGHEGARLNLGSMDYNDDNIDRAMKHYMISAKSGYDKALKLVGEGYKDGYVTKMNMQEHYVRIKSLLMR